MSTTPINPRRVCPLCGGDNECTGAISSEPHQPCWCTAANISRETIARIPAGKIGVCICAKCAQDR
ncbi:MAG: hypothetical protein DMG65_16320 [Candidatus Angelobacter sp. Gp1-AA117]|nr:MAG: hypothetical protein DMG65_16320 [Candidatus Angelobacter sp. Gp1-AA117]